MPRRRCVRTRSTRVPGRCTAPDAACGRAERAAAGHECERASPNGTHGAARYRSRSAGSHRAEPRTERAACRGAERNRTAEHPQRTSASSPPPSARPVHADDASAGAALGERVLGAGVTG